MGNFDFYQPTRVHFGAGRLNDIGSVVSKYGKVCLLVTTSNEEAVLRPLYNRVKGLLKEAGIDCLHFDEVVPNPTIGSIEKAISIVNANNAQVILAVGVGSSIDTAKSIALFYGAGKVDWQDVFGRYTNAFEEYEPLSDPILPVIAVPTTAGTGSEITQAMIISDPSRNEKMCIFHDKVYPREAIIDVELTLTLPGNITASTGFDAFSHAFESYVNDIASPYTKLLGIEAMRLIIHALPKLMNTPDDLSLREDMAKAELFAGISLANAAATIPHPLSEIIGGVVPHISHGQCLATLYPKFIEFISSKKPEKCAVVARLFDENLDGMADAEAAAALPQLVRSFLISIGLNRSLSEQGVTRAELEEMEGNFLFDVLPFAPKDSLIAILRESY